MTSILPNKHGLIVKFDKKKQRERKEKKGNIYLPPQFLYMEYYLQYGEVITIGSVVAEYFPFIQPGDTVLVHHIVEHNDLLCVHTDDDGNEYRAVNATPHKLDRDMCSQVYAVIKKDTGELIPFDTFLFIDNNSLKPLQKEITSDLIYIPDYRNDEAYLARVQQDYTAHRKSLEKTIMSPHDIRLKEGVAKQIDNMERQQNKLAELASAPKKVNATVMYSNEDITGIAQGETIMVDKDTLYPLSIGDVSYFIIRSEFVEKYDMVFE